VAESLIPLLALTMAALLLPPWRPEAPRLAAAVIFGTGLVLARYLWWRLTVTVLPGSTADFGGVVIWIVFLVECLLWYETMLMLLILSRGTRRTAEADGHEAWLRARSPETLPHVDVLIATYNEPLDVLEKTIAGAMALDWPASQLHVHVLDDGKRSWLEDYCAERGVTYLTRPDNSHAKAGNLNAAFDRTFSEFILVLDADFVPQRRMLMRAIGFFADPGVGIVQMPHHFFNSDPVQTNLDMRRSLPDEQRFFFDAVQPGRDGWGCAMCCGSNGIIRRAALNEIGGKMPTESVTEDMLLTLALLRRGYVTRYLGERLAIGLAPENLEGYYTQRSRWAQGGIQILFLANGPFGKRLRLMQRLLFIPSHWITQSLAQPIAMGMPAFFMLTGVPPLLNGTPEAIFSYQLPAIFCGMMALGHFAGGRWLMMSSTVHAVMQAFRIAPTVLATLIRPRGRGFRVTPKGSDNGVAAEDRGTVLIALAILFATAAGMLLNANVATRIVRDTELLPVVAFWAVVNMVILLIVATVAVPRVVHRTEERFIRNEPCRLTSSGAAAGGELIDMSLSGALVTVEEGGPIPAAGAWVGVEIAGAGIVPGQVQRVADLDGAPALGIAFHLPPGPLRDAVIQKLFTTGHALQPPRLADGSATLTMLSRVFARDQVPSHPPEAPETGDPPGWLTGLTGRLTYEAAAARQSHTRVG